MSKLFASVFAIVAIASACDLRSGIAREEMEKFSPSPTPVFSPIPTPTPIDPADSVAVDTSQDGDVIHINGSKEKKSENCSKFNRVLVNGDDNEIILKGVCRQIMVNGDRNKIKSDAGAEFLFNGSQNTLSYSRYANGKMPTVVENRPGNQIDKIATSDKTAGATPKDKK